MLRSFWHAGAGCLLIVSASPGVAGPAQPSCDLDMGADRLLLEQEGLTLPVSLQCPQFFIEGRAVRAAACAGRHGDIGSGASVELRFTPAPLDGGGALEVRLLVQWSPKEAVLRKWASYRLADAPGPRLMEEVILEDIELHGAGTRLVAEQPVISPPQSYPVFLEGFFTGIEFPVSATRVDGQHILVAHRPGIVMQPGVTYETRKAVYGVAKPGAEREAFEHYIEAHRPDPTGFFTNYNHWWSTPVRASEPDIQQLMSTFEEKLYKPYGFHFDTFCIDVGWQKTESIWEMDESNFPDGFATIRKMAAGMKTELGIWVSPSSVYPQATNLEWARAQGYETVLASEDPGGRAYACLGGARYQTRFKERIVDMVRRYHLGSIKFDGYVPECSATDHGHAPGALSSEAIADGMVDVFLAARKANPSIRLRPTCFGWNPSPWWLFYTNSVIGCYGDDAQYGRVPSPVYRESYTSSRDYYNLLLQGAYRSPIPTAAVEVLGIVHQTQEPFMNDAVVTVTRGHMFTPLYLNPKFMSDYRWKQLAGLLKWARDNADVLARTDQLLPASWRSTELPRTADAGPMPREPYGYAHWKGNRGLITLRNPWIAPQTFALKVGAEDAPEPPHGSPRLSAVSLYPEPRLYGDALRLGDTLEVRLAAYETIVLSIGPRQTVKELPNVSGAPPSYVAATVLRQELKRVDLDTSEPALGPSWTSLLGDAPSAIRLRVDADVSVASPSAELLVLMEGGENSPAMPVSHLKINGAEKPLDASPSDAGWASTMLPMPEHWTFLRAPLSQGPNAVSLDLLGGGDCTRISVWVWATKPGSERLRHENGLPEPETISLDSVPLLEPTDTGTIVADAVRAERPVERIDGVFLDALEPAAISQGWGTLQRNRSVWERPMTIAGKRYVRGLGTSSQSRIAYPLDGKYRRFQCWVGADGATSPSVVFEVWVDGHREWESGLMRRDDDAQWVDVDITGAGLLELVVGDGGDGINADHADWAEARLLR